MKGRTYNNFHRGKSLHKTVYVAGKHVYKKGAIETYRELKRRLSKDSMSHIMFPNGLVSGADANQAVAWYKDNGKPVSIVIPSYNDYKILKDCIKSIHQFSESDRYQIFIVDDYCQEDNRKLLRKLEDKKTTVIYRKENGGFSKAVNTGIKAAQKAYPKRDVVLVNSDVVAHFAWLSAMQYGAYMHHKDVGIVGPKLLYPDGRIQSAGSYRNTESPMWFDHYYRFQQADYGPANVPQYCLAVTGACMYIKQSTISKIGILDEKYPFAFEDVDYCLRAWKKGIRTLYYPASSLTHMESASRKKNPTISDKEKRSIEYFWNKWGDWFDSRNVRDENGKIRIIYVLQSNGVSGGIRIVFEHLNRLKDLGYSVELWSLDDDPTWMKLNVKNKKFKNYDALIKDLNKEEAIKVATWWETAFPVWLSSVEKGIPVYFIQEIESWFYPNDPEAQRAVISCYRKEFRNMTTSGYNLDEIRSLGLNAFKVPCGYDDTVFKKRSNVKRDDSTVLALGRSFFQKNFKQTLNAWKLINDKPRLLLYGSEPELVKGENKVDYRVRPTDEEVGHLFNEATLFVQTSYHEGFCLPVLEAMASGCPVITTDSHGNRDFCFDEKNCLVVEKDNEKELQQKMERLLNDRKLQEKLQKKGYETARKYQWDVIMEQLEKFYDIVASQPDGAKTKKEIKKF